MILVVGLGNPGPRYQRTRHNVGFAVLERLSAEVGSPPWVSRFGGRFTEAQLTEAQLKALTEAPLKAGQLTEAPLKSDQLTVSQPLGAARGGGPPPVSALATHAARLLLLAPETFMNRSGESVVQAARHFGLVGSEGDVSGLVAGEAAKADTTPLAERLLVVHDELDLPLGALRLKRGGGDAGHRGVRSIAGVLGSRDFMRLRVGIGRPGPNFEGAISDYVLEAFAPAEERELETQLERSVQAVTRVALHGFEEGARFTNLS